MHNETHKDKVITFFETKKVFIYLEGIMAKKPVMLMILDGFGIAPESDGNAVAAASKPNYDRLVANYPYKQVVCLLDYQMDKWVIQKLDT